MIKKVANFLIASNNLRMMQAFGSHAPAPSKLQKVEETTYQIFI